LAKAPPSTETCTELIATPSLATPETVTVPETVAPLTGLLIETVGGAAATTLMLRLAETEALELSFTAAVKRNDPATVGVPEIAPPELSARPFGSAPLRRLQV
jgi:hypothetical protein